MTKKTPTPRSPDAGPPTLTPSERIDRHIAGISDWRGKVLATIRRLILEADPGVTEDWKWMGTPVWSSDGIVCIANPHAGKVKWTFAQGAKFPDQDHLFNAGLTGNAWRAIDIFEKDRLDEAALGRLIQTAIAYNRSKKKGASVKKKGASPPPAKKRGPPKAPPPRAPRKR